jgi:SSS family solute:Na+ symporter
MNWGSSIVVNDLYLRFIDPDASPRRQVLVGRLATAILLGLGCWLALQMRDALSTFQLVLQVGAGTGLLFLLRWFWWRINALAEIAAMVVSFSVAVAFFIWRQAAPDSLPASWLQMLVGVALTTVAWLTATYLGPPTDRQTLEAFVSRVRPGGPGWRTVSQARSTPARPLDDDLGTAFVATVSATLATWAMLFAIGLILYGRTTAAIVAGFVACAGWLIVWFCWRRLSFR